MKLGTCLLTLGFTCTFANGRPVTTESTTLLRGKKVTRTRTVYPHHTEEGLKPENRNMPDQLVDQRQHSNIGGNVHIEVDGKQQQQQRHSSNAPSHRDLRDNHFHGRRTSSYSNNDGHAMIKDHTKHDLQRKAATPEKKKKEHTEKSMYALPTGLASHFNKSLFDELYEAPFRIHSSILGHEVEDNEFFPIFNVPTWHNMTGIFAGFSKKFETVIFENMQTLLHWHDIEGANSVSSGSLQTFIVDSHFEASLIICKSFKGSSRSEAFLGLVVSYYQYGALKTVLVPFGRLENFFDDVSEQHLLDPETKHLEAEALNELLEEKRSNSSDFYHPDLAHHSKERKEQLEDLEIVHFQKLYQLLIRRTFLFSYGYADCLLTDADNLRECLDDTFYSVVELETSVRGALDEQVINRLAVINETFQSNVQDTCISFQGGMIGTDSCESPSGLLSFITSIVTL